MTEAEWEALLTEAETRAARYGELLETFHDEPGGHEMIEEAMGWKGDAGAFADEVGSDDGNDDAADPEDDCESLPVYCLARDTGMAVHRVLQPLLDGRDGDASDEVTERLGSAYIHALIPAAKIAGGHAMGDDDDSLGGNIVCNKRALEAVITSIEDLQWLSAGGHVPADVATSCLRQLEDLREEVERRLAELRGRVWR